MSLELDPEFVASKVHVLEGDIANIEDSFVATFERLFHVQTDMARKESQLRWIWNWLTHQVNVSL